MNDDIIVCRCEDITETEVKEAIRAGASSLEELKRYLRVGMGSCQGRTCGPILLSLLTRELQKSPQDIQYWQKRPPLKPVPAKTFFGE